MALDGVKNFAKVEVSTGYDASATSIVLSTDEGAKLPDPATAEYNVVWWNFTDYPDPADDPNVEIVRVTAKTTDTLTVTRNQESSGASTKNTSGKTYKMVLGVTAKMITDIETEISGAGGGNKTVWLDANSAGIKGTGVIQGFIDDPFARGVIMSDGNDNQQVTLNWVTPSDFTSISSVLACWRSPDNGNAYLYFESAAMGAGELYSSVTTDSIALTTYASGAGGLLVQSNVTAMINGLTLSENDIVSFGLRRDGAQASDTLSGSMYFYGFIVTYA